jgi:hypothetical protein
MANVRIWWDSQVAAYRIAMPYSQEFVSAIKALIPASDRAFDPTTKVWTFTERFFDPMQLLCEKVYGKHNVVAVTRQQAQSAQAPASITKFTAAQLAVDFLTLVGFDAAQAAYRRGAVALHPDHGGNLEKMTKLNAVWQRLEKEVFHGQ